MQKIAELACQVYESLDGDSFLNQPREAKNLKRKIEDFQSKLEDFEENPQGKSTFIGDMFLTITILGDKIFEECGETSEKKLWEGWKGRFDEFGVMEHPDPPFDPIYDETKEEDTNEGDDGREDESKSEDTHGSQDEGEKEE